MTTKQKRDVARDNQLALVKVLAENAATEVMDLWWMNTITSVNGAAKRDVIAQIIERQMLQAVANA
jgi:hypothetical protein